MDKWNLIKIFVLLLISAGCATTAQNRVNPDLQQMQERITYLENELQNKNQEITKLETQLYQKGLTQSQPSQEEDNIPQTQKPEKTAPITKKNVQIALKNAGFYRGKIDGDTGIKTKQAIKEFQKANGLNPDGVIGKKTWQKLSGYLR